MEATTVTDTQAQDGERPTNFSDPRLWLKPFDELVRGDTFRTKARTITESDVVQFAALTADWHPAHTDATWAEKNMFGQRVAHGMLLVSYSIGLVPNDYVLALRRLKNVVFKRPVFLGETIHVEGKVARLTPMDERAGMVTGRWKIVKQNGDMAASMEIEALWRRDRL